MEYLLDTQVLLWYMSGDKRLNEQHRRLLTNAKNDVYVSVVSYWEIAIKESIGKLSIPYSVIKLEKVAEMHGFRTLPFSIESLSLLKTLDTEHKDPFDRYILCQSFYSNLELLTADEKILEFLNRKGKVQILD